MAKGRRPVVLLVLDGWGIGKKGEGNAIANAAKPNYDSYLNDYPHTALSASSIHVGLPRGQDGNSEAGHMNIGAGRIVEQDSVTISKSISDGTFFKNPAFLQAVKHVKANKSRVHLIGMLSDGQSAHSDPDHLVALVMLFHYHNIEQTYVHLFTDGRDSPKYSAIKILRKYKNLFNYRAHISSVIGRFYAMDRKKAWSRTKQAYDAMVMGTAKYTASSAEEAILQSYNRGESDEYISPTMITADGKPLPRIGNKDAVIFFNLRSDRARQMSKPFVQSNFEKANVGSFKRAKILKGVFFVAMTDFGPDLENILTAFPSRDLVDCLPMILGHKRQMYISESEKYAHMTYFINGGYDSPVSGEDRIMVPSPHVRSYDQTPAMALPAITKKIVSALNNKSYDFIAANFSNPDMIAHTGNLEATVKAIEYVDTSLGTIVDAALKNKGVVLITGDHGNAEELINYKTGEIDTEHSKSAVPFLMIGDGLSSRLRKKGVLADVAPTILDIMAIKKPTLMTGKSLIL